jgi:hypothetical protein
MSLPIDIAGSLWFMPTAVWEWEPEPPSADEAGCTAQAAETGEPPAMRLVFKGYTNATAFHWFAADSLLSRPWTAGHADDAHRRRADEPPPPDDDVAKKEQP